MSRGSFTEPNPYATDYYDRLGVTPDADSDAIEDHYRDHVARLHPDVSDYDDPSEAFIRFEDAESVLTDPELRDAYDTFRTRRDVTEPVAIFEAWNARGRPDSPDSFALQSHTTGTDGTGGPESNGGTEAGPDDGGPGGSQGDDDPSLEVALRRLDQLVSSLRSTHQYLDSLLRESLTDEQVELARDQLETYDRELDQAWSLFGRIRDDLSDRREARLGDTLEELVEARREIESLLDRHERGEGDADGRSGTGGDTTTGTGSGTGDSPATDGGRSGTDPARAAAVDAATDGWFRAGFLLSGASLSVAGYYILLGLFRLLDPTRSVVENVPQAFTISWVGGGLLLWFVTSRWTSAVESTGAPDAVYDGLLVRPGRVKQAVIVGLGAAIVTELLPLPTAVDDVVSPTLGLLFWGSVVLYGFTQVYHVTLERIGS